MLALLLAGVVAGAQEPAPRASGPDEAPRPSGPEPAAPSGQMESRFQIAAMEAVLEQAVQLGASNVNMRLQAIAPDMVFLTGAPRARGFRLENYGLFFDVDVPVMRRSLQWTFRVLRQNDAGVAVAVQSLRRRVETIQDAALRQELEREVRRIEREVPAIRTTSTAGSTRGDGRPPAAVADDPVGRATQGGTMLDDPGQAYTNAVKQALTNAMLEYSTKFALAPDDWLTVAARDQEGSRRAVDPYGVSTIVLRVRGADVKAFHSGQIDIEEARSRVEVREY